MKQTTSAKNKTLVLEAFDTLFNKRDYVAAERYWSPNYIQHSAHIEPGRAGLFNLIKSSPPTLKYEPGSHRGRRGFRDRPRAFLGTRPAEELDRSGHPSHRRWGSYRALGCAAGRGFARGVEERPSHVRHRIQCVSGDGI